jgi:hypothetical protein
VLKPNTSLRLEDEGKNGVIYSLFYGEQSQFDLFIADPSCKNHKDFDDIFNIVTQLANAASGDLEDYVGKEFEADPSFPNAFRHEFGNKGYAIPHWAAYTTLRLYCILWNPTTLILCNGGIHDMEGQHQDHPILGPMVAEFLDVEKAINRAIEAGTYEDSSTLPGFYPPGNRHYEITIC